jgi:prepilin-type N-terminal cleavage/methylation domain-containing protein
MKRAFTLMEVLVVIGVIGLLMALALPGLRLAREQADETVCKSHLRQMAMVLGTYCSGHDSTFPHPGELYHSRASTTPDVNLLYPVGCRWHDAEIGVESPLMLQEHKEYQGVLLPYLSDPKILLCKSGARANFNRGCHNQHHPRSDGRDIPIAPQYTYMMNALLGTSAATGQLGASKTIRSWPTQKETQVTRSPSEVFVFGEENSWAMNPEAKWPTSYHLSHFETTYPVHVAPTSAILFSGLRIRPSYEIEVRIGPSHEIDRGILRVPDVLIGDAFATYHRPHGGDLNTGYSFVAMLDGHVRKVTVSDQLRKSRQVDGIPPSPLGPGGNLSLAWPLDVPPLGGWENQ